MGPHSGQRLGLTIEGLSNMQTGGDGKKTFADLIAVMAALRNPDGGCPWDLQQDFASIAPYTVEEAYEVADAIARGDLVDLEEELGDLLLQVVYHAQMAAEAGAFEIDDVTDGIVRKMLRRHPHVFGSPEERAAGMAPGSWERIKAEEKAEKLARRTELAALHDHASDATEPTPSSVLDGVPPALPGLRRAVKLQDKAARVGFDWPGLAPVFDKMREELDELSEACTSGDAALTEEEFGDLMFVMANVARHLKLDPEAALQAANAKFERRFRMIEAGLAARGKTPAQSDLEEMDALWDAAKRAERARPSQS